MRFFAILLRHSHRGSFLVHRLIIIATFLFAGICSAATDNYVFECQINGTFSYGVIPTNFVGPAMYNQTSFTTKKRRIYIRPSQGTYSDSNIFLPEFKNGMTLDLNEEFGFRILISLDETNNLFFFSFKVGANLGHSNMVTRLESVSNFHSFDTEYTTSLNAQAFWLKSHQHQSSFLRAKLDCDKTEY